MQNAHSIVTETTSSSAPSPQKTCFEHPPLGVELAFRRLNWKDVQILFTARVRHAEGVRLAGDKYHVMSHPVIARMQHS